MELSWDKILEFMRALGIVKGVFVIFFFMAHSAIFALYRGRLKDRQDEIDRLAGENKEHRERFTALIDKQLHVPRGLLGLGGGKKKRRRK